jgi:hypothetical protein
MAYMTASAVVDAARSFADWSGASDTQVLQMLNLVKGRMEREHDFTWQEQVASRTLTTSASGFSRFAQPTDAKELRYLYFIESSERKELAYLNYYDALAEFPNPSDTPAKPEAWALFRDEIYLFPRLNSAVSAELYYLRFLPELTATGSNDFLVWAGDALLYGTLREYHAFIGETDRSQYWQGLLGDAVTSLLKYHTATKHRPQISAQMRTPGTMTGSSRGGRPRVFNNSRW